MSKNWTKYEMELLRRGWEHGGTAAALELLPDRGKFAIQRQASRMGIRAGNQTGVPKGLYPDPDPVVAAALKSWRGAQPGQLQGRAF